MPYKYRNNINSEITYKKPTNNYKHVVIGISIQIPNTSKDKISKLATNRHTKNTLQINVN